MTDCKFHTDVVSLLRFHAPCIAYELGNDLRMLLATSSEIFPCECGGLIVPRPLRDKHYQLLRVAGSAALALALSL